MDVVQKLDIGFVPNAGAPAPIFFSSEDTTVLLFYGQPTDGAHQRDRILVEAPGCVVAKFGYPNDEALPGHPLYPALSYYTVHEVLEPSWRQRIIEQNRVKFPLTPPHYARLRHFIITFQDSTFECLAQDLRASRVSGAASAILKWHLEDFDKSA